MTKFTILNLSTEEIMTFYDILFNIYGSFHHKEYFLFYLFYILLHYKPSKIQHEHTCISGLTGYVYIYIGRSDSDHHKKSNITSKIAIVLSFLLRHYKRHTISDRLQPWQQLT